MIFCAEQCYKIFKLKINNNINSEGKDYVLAHWWRRWNWFTQMIKQRTNF